MTKPLLLGLLGTALLTTTVGCTGAPETETADEGATDGVSSEDTAPASDDGITVGQTSSALCVISKKMTRSGTLSGLSPAYTSALVSMSFNNQCFLLTNGRGSVYNYSFATAYGYYYATADCQICP